MAGKAHILGVRPPGVPAVMNSWLEPVQGKAGEIISVDGKLDSLKQSVTTTAIEATAAQSALLLIGKEATHE